MTFDEMGLWGAFPQPFFLLFLSVASVSKWNGEQNIAATKKMFEQNVKWIRKADLERIAEIRRFEIFAVSQF